MAQDQLSPQRDAPRRSDARLSAVVCPLTPRELPQALRNFDSWEQVPPCAAAQPPAERPLLIFSFNCATDEAMTAQLHQAYAAHPLVREAFAGIEVRYCNLPPEKDLYIRDRHQPAPTYGHKAGPNWLFYETMKALRDQAQFVFQMETDCTPIVPGWLARLQNLCAQNRDAWVIGAQYTGASPLHYTIARHINGNAIYQVGDPAFWVFLDGVLWPWMHAFIQSHPTLAYDCAWETWLNRPEMQDPAHYDWVVARPVMHRYRATPVIVNLAGDAELRGQYLWTREDILARSPQAAIVHGPLQSSPDHIHGQFGLGTPRAAGDVQVEDGTLRGLPHAEQERSFRRTVWLRDEPLDDTCTLEVAIEMECAERAGVIVDIRDPCGRKIFRKKVFGKPGGGPRKARLAIALPTRHAFVSVGVLLHAAEPGLGPVTLANLRVRVLRDGKLLGVSKRFLQ